MSEHEQLYPQASRELGRMVAAWHMGAAMKRLYRVPIRASHARMSLSHSRS
jgi:hypothetical protein